jgi:hypothetical protein
MKLKNFGYIKHLCRPVNFDFYPPSLAGKAFSIGRKKKQFAIEKFWAPS